MFFLFVLCVVFLTFCFSVFFTNKLHFDTIPEWATLGRAQCGRAAQAPGAEQYGWAQACVVWVTGSGRMGGWPGFGGFRHESCDACAGSQKGG